MATIRRRGKSWQAQIRRRPHRPISRSFRSKKDAETWARMVEARIDRAGLPASRQELNSITLANLLTRYKKEITPKKKSAEKETHRLNKLLRHDLAKAPLSDLTVGKIAAYREERLLEVGSQAVIHYLNLLHNVLKTAAEEWDIRLPENPAAAVKRPKPPKPRNRRVTPDELARLEETADHRLNGLATPLIRLAVETGMRQGELVNARWRDVDLDRRTLLIANTKNGHRRTIPLTGEAVRTLRNVPASDERIFPISGNALRQAWRRWTKKAAITDLHFHDLRHEAISRFFEMGLSIPEVALISGHRDYRMLFRYTHLRAEDVAKKLDWRS